MAGKKRHVDDINVLIRATRKLRSDLQGFLRKYPEDDLDPDDRIFERLFTNVWRNTVNTAWRNPAVAHRPYQEKEFEAVELVDRVENYLKDLVKFFRFVVRKPALLATLPLNSSAPAAAKQCIEKLYDQEFALKRIQTDEFAPDRANAGQTGLEPLLSDLRRIARRKGTKHCASESGLNPDTINDLLEGRVRRPHKETRAKLEKFVNDEAPRPRR